MGKVFVYYKRFLEIALRYKYRYFGSWIFLIGLLFLNSLIPLAIGSIIDSADSNSKVFEIVLLVGVFLALPLLVEPAGFHLKTRVMSRAIRDTTSEIYKKVIGLDYSFHVDKSTGKIISIILSAADSINSYLWILEWNVVENFTALAFPTIIIAFIRPDLALIIIFIILILSPLMNMAIKFNVNARKRLKDADYLKNGVIIDGITNFETVKSFAREEYEYRQVDLRVDDSRIAMEKYQNSFRVIDFVSRIIGVVVFIVGGYYSANLLVHGEITLGTAVVLITYLSQMTLKIMGMIFSFRDVIKNVSVFEDFWNLYDSVSDIKEVEKPIEVKKFEGNIEYKNVGFSYNTSNTVLNNLDLKIQPNQTVALVGPSGGGKSTVTRLLMRYYDLNTGEITIDGNDIAKMRLVDLRSQIGLVPQEPTLFNRSIFYNVGYALDNIENLDNEQSREQIIDACKKAKIHDFIESLPEKYETIVGERGLKLSGGQKQRIAIARVLIKNPEIVIFDEATSMLDSESEKAIQIAFKNLSKDKTVIVIAHRLSTIKESDNIFVIDEGKVHEEGTHEELIKKNGIYKNLWDIQSGGFSAGR